MKPSPLQLERHFFTKILVEAHPDAEATNQGELHAQVEVARGTNDARKYQLTLCLKLQPVTEKKPPYTAELHIVGLVRVVDAWPEEKVQQLVQANGPALLYGAAREMLCNLTSRGPWPMVCLNSVTFVELRAAIEAPGGPVATATPS